MNKTNNYTVMSNEHLKDRRLSLKAKGLLSVMLSLPDTWDYSISGLVAICKESETAVKSTLNELKSCGYLVVTKKMPDETESGRIEYVYDIFEHAKTGKQADKKQGVENLGVENLEVESLGVENVRQLSTKKSNTDKSTTNKKKESTRAAYDEIIESYTENEELRNALIEFVKMRKMIKKPLTNKALTLLLTSKKGLDGLASSDAEKIDIVNQTVMHSWQGFYPLKDDGDSKQAKQSMEQSQETKELIELMETFTL